MFLFVDISCDPPQVQRVSPADHKSTIFAENATFSTIFDDRDDWKSREVHIMFNPRDPPYTLETGGSLTGLDIEVCRAVFDHAGIRYRFVERPPITSPDYAKYRSSVLKYLETERIELMVSSLVFQSPFGVELRVFDKKGFCLILPKNLQRNVIYHLVHPFEYSVWILIVMILFLDLLLIRLFPLAFPHNLVMILLFGDSCADHQQTRPTRYYCFGCTVLLFLLSEAYLAKAIIYMTVTRYTPDMKTLAEVIASEIQFKLPPGGKQPFDRQNYVHDRLWQQSFEVADFRYDMADDRYGYMASCRYGEYLIERHVRQEILDFGHRAAKRRFYLLDEMVEWEFRYYVAANHFTFYRRMELAVNWLYEAGLWDRWMTQFRYNWGYGGFNHHLWDENDILALEDILAIWYIMAIGLGVAAAVFLLEKMSFRVKKCIRCKACCRK
ncbi:uncharacterized protein LOC119766414 [Culex quinquefasciatus]|uniref:uncharacterized protein LOC119766414 n=1 Tax=Culex quinquefasciatus TaxID=7176 RepID=UPI0018E2DF2D|nr:uncharacterized protein LOC119766414 [Culex quinquefasciatus]